MSSKFWIQGNSYGNTEDTLKILHRNKEGLMMNTLEQFHIHTNETKLTIK
jgi:hypothetical protein